MNEFDITVQSAFGSPNSYAVCNIGLGFHFTASIARCGEYDGGIIPVPEGETKSIGQVDEELIISTSTYFDNINFKSALQEIAASSTLSDTTALNDLLAADMYYELLLAEIDSTVSDSLRRVTDALKWHALNSYKAAIERLFVDSTITVDANSSSFEPVVQNYVDILMAFTDSVKTPENYKEQFKLELNKVSLFNILLKPELSLQILSNISYCDHDSPQWLILQEEIQRAEYLVLARQLQPEQLLNDTVGFQLDSSFYAIPLDALIDTTGFGSYINSPNSVSYSVCEEVSTKRNTSINSNRQKDHTLFPNPSNGSVQIFVENWNFKEGESLVMQVFDQVGRKVSEMNIVKSSSEIDLTALPSGIYFYQIGSATEIHFSGKIILTK